MLANREIQQHIQNNRLVDDQYLHLCSQVLKEQSKSSKLKGDLMNMEAVLEWESYFGQVNWSPQYHHYIIRKYLFSTLIFQANYYKNQQNYEAAHREASVEKN